LRWLNRPLAGDGGRNPGFSPRTCLERSRHLAPFPRFPPRAALPRDYCGSDALASTPSRTLGLSRSCRLEGERGESRQVIQRSRLA
jgi:hypothetical protein